MLKSTTEAGAAYSVSAQSTSSLGGGPCTNVTVNTTGPNGQISIGDCIRTPATALLLGVSCNSGLLTVAGETPAGSTSVKLSLSNGTAITIPVTVLHAAALKGTGWAFTALKGPAPVPTRAVALNSSGTRVALEKLTILADCTQNPISDATKTLLASAKTSAGTPFTIVANHYREYGHVYFCLDGGLPSSGTAQSSAAVICPAQLPGPYGAGQFITCKPTQFELIYGLLRDPTDTVKMSANGKPLAVTQTPLPVSVHATGDLVYASAPLTTVTVKVLGAGGAAVSSETVGSADQAKSCT
jgi:hypothetical protein